VRGTSKWEGYAFVNSWQAETNGRISIAVRLSRFSDVEILGECGDSPSAIEISTFLLMLSFPMFRCPAWMTLRFSNPSHGRICYRGRQ
jgi:hypothetical protein